MRFFGPAAEKAGCSETEVETEGTVGAVIAVTLKMIPDLKSLSRDMRYARNSEYASLECPLEEGDVVSFLPPVGGG